MRLDGKANIFIGGSILDRGVTIKNLISFFYGRNADRPQQDTVLQHSRMYGARPLEDMAVTRLHTTRRIYDMLVKMNEIDENLRESIRRGGGIGDLQIQFIGQDNRFKPCGNAKIRASDALSIKGRQRVLPRGFQTRSPREIKASVEEIDELIANLPSAGFADAGFKLMTLDTALKILDLIEKTFKYDDADREYASDTRRLKASLLYCVDQAAKLGKKEFYALVRTDREANRLSRIDGGITDSPDSGEGDAKPAKKAAIDVPVLMLFREKGDINKVKANWAGGREVNIGWRGAPFYWPVLLTQKNLESALFVLDERDELAPKSEPSSPLREGLDPALVLDKSYQEDIESAFGAPGTKYKRGDEKIYWQILKENNARDYILKDDSGDLIPATQESDTSFGVNTLNKGVFPFVPIPYEYLLLKHGSKHCLLKLTPPKYWDFRPLMSFADGNLIDPKTKKVIMRASDIITDHKTLKKRKERDKNVCVWKIGYKVAKVIRAIDVSSKGKDSIGQ